MLQALKQSRDKPHIVWLLPHICPKSTKAQGMHTVQFADTHTHTQSPRGVLEAARKYFFLTRNVFLLVLIFRASQEGNKKRYFSMRN